MTMVSREPRQIAGFYVAFDKVSDAEYYSVVELIIAGEVIKNLVKRNPLNKSLL